MLPADLLRRGEHVATVCNACRYCEAYCPAFRALEDRRVFRAADLAYLANLCHNCGECLYACQYAPPHEFGINVPRLFAEIRLASYEEAAWPRAFAIGFRRHGLVASLALVISFVALMLAARSAIAAPGLDGDFYRILPHAMLVGLFGAVFLGTVALLLIGLYRFWRLMGQPAMPDARAITGALRDAATLRHLHSGDPHVDCTDAEETRAPWRRWLHHCTMYGYALCFASTTVAAVYHTWFGWRAPYAWTSLPVVLGATGGLGLLVGPAGLLMLKGRRDRALNDPAQRSLDITFTVLLFATSLTGLLLLVFRASAGMGVLLVVHLACVLTLFVTMPYSKFVHGLLRTAALTVFALEQSRHRGEHDADG
jgi:citrate/tricarballylate utilization protein